MRNRDVEGIMALVKIFGKTITALLAAMAVTLSPALAERGVTDDEIIIGSHSALS
jgi:hypothetical protein